MCVYRECLNGANAALMITRCNFFSFLCSYFVAGKPFFFPLFFAHPQTHACIYTLWVVQSDESQCHWFVSYMIFENVSSVLKKNLFSLQRLNACWCWISLQCTLTCERNRIAAFDSTGRRDHRWGRRMRKWKRDGLVRKYKNRMHFYASTCWKCL